MLENIKEIFTIQVMKRVTKIGKGGKPQERQLEISILCATIEYQNHIER